MRRPHPATLVAIVALVLAGTSTGYAAGTLVTSKQIKDRTIKVRDISPTARARLRGNTGPAGDQGPRGYSAWDPIPSGTLVGGAWTASGADGLDTPIAVNLPGLAPVELDLAHLARWPSTHCGGTVFAPDPDPGYACVSDYGFGAKGGTTPTASVDVSGQRDRAFVIQVSAPGDSAFNMLGAWAYRAP